MKTTCDCGAELNEAGEAEKTGPDGLPILPDDHCKPCCDGNKCCYGCGTCFCDCHI